VLATQPEDLGRDVCQYIERSRPLHDRQVSDSMLETALGQGDGAA
jgi:hypothetical protein